MTKKLKSQGRLESLDKKYFQENTECYMLIEPLNKINVQIWRRDNFRENW